MSDPWSGPLPLRGGRSLPGRLWLAALTNLQSPDGGRLSEAERAFLERRARGGMPVITTCAAYVHPDGQAWPGQLGVADDAQGDALRPLATGLAAHGAAGLVQLFHGGGRADPALTGQAAWSLSAWADAATGGVAVAAASSDRLERAVVEHTHAALRVEAAGLAGVELHGAHGYLLSQGLSRTYNTRPDAWGGDLAGRARLLRACLRAVRAATGPGFVVGVRLSPEDMGQARGLDLDESLQVAAWLAEDGADFIHLSLWDCARTTNKRPDTHPLPLFRAAVGPEIALVAAGAIWDRADVEAVFAKGADAVAVGRAAIGQADWAQRILTGTPIRRAPFPAAVLAEEGASQTFVDYLGRFRGMVAT